MSQENVQLVERVLEEAKHNPAALWEVLDDEVIWEVGNLDIPDAGATHWHGPGGVREFFRRWVGPFDEWGYEVGEVMMLGTRSSLRSTSGAAARGAACASSGTTGRS
jgi:SnoaL-like domain